jgi:hypothetical protein
MAENDKTKETGAAPNSNNKVKSDAKQARLAEALRANLRRRKDQSRERKDS